MAAPIPLRSDFDAAQLRRLARKSRDPDQTPPSLGGCGDLRSKVPLERYKVRSADLLRGRQDLAPLEWNKTSQCFNFSPLC